MEGLEFSFTLMFLIFLVAYFIATSPMIIHEMVHLFQADFNYTDYCFYGQKGDAVGWVDSSNFPDEKDDSIETTAYDIETLYLIVIGLLCWVFVWKFLNIKYPAKKHSEKEKILIQKANILKRDIRCLTEKWTVI
jgi:hypothetical protein